MSLHSSTPWVLGLDGGGTQTRVAFATKNGEVHGPFIGEGCNPFDRPDWQEVLTELLHRSGARQANLKHAVLGLPGYGETATVDAAQQSFAAKLECSTTVVNDVAIAFHGAFAGGAGVLLLAGTGSMAWAGDGSERTLRVGGFGPDFGDEGSSHWIGMKALQLLSWHIDGRAHDDDFAAGMGNVVTAGSLTELLNWFYAPGHLRSKVAALAKRVDELAKNGNASARNILREAAEELARLANAAGDRLNLTGVCPLSLAGGLFSSTQVTTVLLELLEGHFEMRPAVLNPLGGALLLAAERAGWSTGSTWVETVTKATSAAK